MLNPRLFYNILLWVLLPYIFIRLFWRARQQPEYLRHIGERFGFYSIQFNRPIIWLHTVSVGETRAAQNIIAQLRANYPNQLILLTHTTPTGRAASEQLYAGDVIRVYLPYDYPFAVNRFIHYFKPQLGILFETEIWFNLIHACRKSKTPLLLLNARMSDKSFRGYAKFAHLTSDALSNLAAIAAQTSEDATRLESLGAKNVTVTGNLKFDIEPPPSMLEMGKQLRMRFNVVRKVFLAASTRDGEETLLLEAMQNVHIPSLLFVIVPRHPQRFDEVATLLKKNNIPFLRKSCFNSKNGLKGHTVPADIQVVLGDTMGELLGYYAAADIAFIGGSLLPFGGQNLIESCAVGTPVLIGPHNYNFAEVARKAVEAGVALQITDAEQLFQQIKFLMDSPSVLLDMKKRCKGFIESNCGATNKSMQIIAKALNNQS